jgi:hypothetical protein
MFIRARATFPTQRAKSLAYGGFLIRMKIVNAAILHTGRCEMFIDTAPTKYFSLH